MQWELKKILAPHGERFTYFELFGLQDSYTVVSDSTVGFSRNPRFFVVAAAALFFCCCCCFFGNWVLADSWDWIPWDSRFSRILGF